MKFNEEKLQLAFTKIHFLGHVISGAGIQVDKSKVEAILNIGKPSNVKELQKFLSSVSYLGRFIENVSDKTAPLRLLLKKGTEWI